ncbi:MAG: hypothetical protein AAFZ52_02270 [Bacteroidota bacterium]
MNFRCLFFLLCFSGSLFAQLPTTPASNLTVTASEGDRATIRWQPGDGSRRICVLRANASVIGLPQNGLDYNADLLFGAGDVISPGEFVLYDGTGTSVSVRGLAPATVYHLAVFEYNGSGQATEYLPTALTGSFTTVTAPTEQASEPTVVDVTGHSAAVRWTNGNGGRRLVVLRKGEPVNANPVDLTTYLGRLDFPNGGEIGTDNFVVFNGNSTEITVISLEPGVTYHGAIFEYNGVAGPVYALPGAPYSFTTATRPAVAASAFGQSTDPATIEGGRITVNYRNGDGRHRLIVASAGPISWTPEDDRNYSANSVFGAGEEVSPGVYALQNIQNTATSERSLTVSGLLPATTYHFAIWEYNRNPDGSMIFYQQVPPATATASTTTAPAAAPPQLTFSNNTGNSVRLEWTATDAQRYLVVARAGSPVDFVPSDLANYVVDNRFGSRELPLLGNYGVYDGTGTGFTMTALSAGTEYHFAVFAYNGRVTPVYQTTPTRAVLTSLATPRQNPTDLGFTRIEGDGFSVTWTAGDGSRQLIIARAGAPVSTVPQDSVTYETGPFGSGTELSPGEFAVWDGVYNTFNPPPINGLAIGTEYHVAVFEYNLGPDGKPFYRRTDPGRGSQSSAPIPTVASPAVSIADLSSNSVRLTADPGNGERRLVVMRANAPVDFIPDQLTNYVTSNDFGRQDLGGGNAAIARLFTTTAVNVNGLEPNTTYHVAVFEYNGTTRPAYQITPTRFTFTTGRYPTQPVRNLRASSIGATRLALSWTNGNGERRLVVARPATAPDAPPEDDQTYQANAIFGAGSPTGPDNFVVFSGTGRTVTVTNLRSGTAYVFTVYETADNATNNYYAVPGTSLTVTTAAPPAAPPVNLQVNNVTPTSATVAWTSGDGTGEAVLLRAENPVDTFLQDGTFIPPRADFASALPIGNARSLFFGSRTFVDVSGLEPGTPYHVLVQAYNGISQSPAYEQTGARTLFRTIGPPSRQAEEAAITSAASNKISLDWTNGNGVGRIVLARRGGPVDAVPEDGVAYVANTFFGAGDEIGSGNFVVAFNDLDTLSISNLLADAEYHFAVFEHNGTRADPLFNPNNPARASVVAALPVTWGAFSVRADDKGTAHLSWSTLWEENTDHFRVEHSTDGRDFFPVGRVAARGLAATYTYVYPGLVGGTHFFRLRQVDLDGAYAFSGVRQVVIAAGRLRLYPNPVRTTLFLTNRFTESYRVVDVYGREVLRGAAAGAVDVGGLTPGTYLLLVGPEKRRFVKK